MLEQISIHEIRADQLRNLAERLNITMSELIERLTSLLMRRNLIPDRFSEFRIDRLGELITFEIAGVCCPMQTFDRAVDLHAFLENFVKSRTAKLARFSMGDDYSLIIQRVGPAFRLSVRDGAETLGTVVLSRAIMFDIDRQMSNVFDECLGDPPLEQALA